MRQILALSVLVGLVIFCVGCGGSTPPPAPEQNTAPPAPVVAEPVPDEQPPAEEPKPVEEPKPAEEETAEVLPPEAQTPEGRSMWNLKKLAEAMKAYHEKNGRFPAAATLSKEEKPLLSWRVQLLPFLKQEALFNEFHQDEPWDSDHNKALLAKMPEVFKTPGGPEGDKTCYLVAAGMGTVFGQREGIARNLIADGAEKTIMIVEADPDRAASWTAPEDLQYIPASPSAGLGGLRDKAFLVAFADGTVRKLSLGLGQDLLRALFSRNGRELVDLAMLDGQPGEDGKIRKPTEGMLLQAEQYFAQGDHKRGMLYLMADGVIRGHEDVMGSIGWCPALKRPVLMLRFGLMIQTAAPTGAQALAAAAAGGGLSPMQQEAIGFWGQAVGMPMLGRLESRIAEGMFGEFNRPAPQQAVAAADQPAGVQGPEGMGAEANEPAAVPQAPRPAPQMQRRRGGGTGIIAANLEGVRRRAAAGPAMADPAGLPELGGQSATPEDIAQAQALGIVNLGINDGGGGGGAGAGANRRATQKAQQENLDVLIVAAIATKIARVRGKPEPQVESSVTLRAVDVMRNETIWTAKPLSSAGATPEQQQQAEGQAQQGTPLFARGLMRELFDFIDEQLALVDVPALPAEAVRQRAETLASSQYSNPLPVLLELRYYEYKKLLTPEDISGYFAKIVGEDQGPTLATGPMEQRKEIVQRWLGRAD